MDYNLLLFTLTLDYLASFCNFFIFTLLFFQISDSNRIFPSETINLTSSASGNLPCPKNIICWLENLNISFLCLEFSELCFSIVGFFYTTLGIETMIICDNILLLKTVAGGLHSSGPFSTSILYKGIIFFQFHIPFLTQIYIQLPEFL